MEVILRVPVEIELDLEKIDNESLFDGFSYSTNIS